MTAKEKAEELVTKYIKLDIEIGGQFDGYLTLTKHDAKQCALIVVDEILYLPINEWSAIAEPFQDWNYWQQVKSEIEKL